MGFESSFAMKRVGLLSGLDAGSLWAIGLALEELRVASAGKIDREDAL